MQRIRPVRGGGVSKTDLSTEFRETFGFWDSTKYKQIIEIGLKEGG